MHALSQSISAFSTLTVEYVFLSAAGTELELCPQSQLSVCVCMLQLALEALGSELSPPASSMVSELVASQQGRPLPGRRRAFVPSPAQLKALPLQYGQNTVDFIFAGQRQRAYIYFFNWNSRQVTAALQRSSFLQLLQQPPS